MKQKYFLLLFSLFFTAVAFGQMSPLQINVVLVPPYSVYLPDHAAGGQEQLRINIVQIDRNQPSYDFLLRIEILHQGSVLMRTRTDFRPFPITITPGKLLTLSGNMVLPYLLEENLEFINYNRDLYYRTKALPEGTITIKVTAHDYYRPKIKVSQTAQTQFWLSKNDPPYLISPQDKQQLVIFNAAMPINFSWQSRNFSPNSIVSTTYKFQLFEVYDPKSNPNQVVVSQNPFYEREFNFHQTNLVYGVSEPPLTLGKQYVWRVQSIDRTGRDMYKNQGWSMVHQFQYGQDPTTAPLPPVTGLAIAIKENTATISWDYHPDHKKYEVFFHNRDMADDYWNKVTTSQLKYTTRNVTYDKEITVKVRAVNEERYSAETYPEVFVCPKPQPKECGVPPPPLEPINPNSPLLKSMLPGTVFRCDKNFVYTVRAGEMEGDGFTGVGTVPVPLFGNMVMNVSFKNVKVNEDLRYVSGAINFLARKNVNSGSVDGDKIFDGSGTNNGKGGVNVDVKVNFTIPDNAAVENVKVVNDSTVSFAVTDANGNPKTVEISYKKQESEDKTATTPDISGATIQDKSGTVFSVTPDGKGGYSLTPQAKQEKKIKFPEDSIHNTFAELDFDVFNKDNEYYKVSKLEKQYTKTTLFENTYHKLERENQAVDRYYYVPIFSVNPSENLKITGKFISNTEDVDVAKVKFMTTEGVVLTSKYDEGSKHFELNLSPSAVGNSQRYFAVCEHQKRTVILGGFEVMTYPEKLVSLVLVPVNGIGKSSNAVDVNSITAYLNKVYGVANVRFSVKLAESFDYNGETKLMENEKSGVLEKYTPSMLDMNNAYLEKVGDSFDKNSLYLFLLNFGAASGDMAGFMPRQSQLGYIFLNKNDVVNRTVAHELGHGLAAMSHTFNAKYGSLTKESTNNLMDYGDGIALQKLQWDLLHSKVEVWKVFERDKDAMQKKIPIKTADEQSIFLAAQLFKEYIVDENIKPKDFNYQNLSSEKKYEFLRRYEQGKTADVFRTMSDNQHYLEHRQGEEQIYANFIYELFERITTVESLIEIPFYQEKLVQILKGEYLQEIFSPDITGTILSLGASNNWTPQKYFTNNSGKWITTSRNKITPEKFERVVGKLEGKVKFNFTKTATTHMDEIERMIPIQTLDDIIQSPMAIAKDPQGTRALMHYSQMWKNGKLYNVEVLYDKVSNTIMHFQYGRNAMGPLLQIPK